MPPLAVKALGLSDYECTIALELASPLQPTARELFLEELASAVQGTNDYGEGRLFRLAREIQARHFIPPSDRVAVGGSRGTARKTLGATPPDEAHPDR
jgi:hypothetical protein